PSLMLSSNTPDKTDVRTNAPDTKTLAVTVALQLAFIVHNCPRSRQCLVSEIAAHTSGLRPRQSPVYAEVESACGGDWNRARCKKERSGTRESVRSSRTRQRALLGKG